MTVMSSLMLCTINLPFAFKKKVQKKDNLDASRLDAVEMLSSILVLCESVYAQSKHLNVLCVCAYVRLYSMNCRYFVSFKNLLESEW